MKMTQNNSASLKNRWDYLTKDLTQQFSDGDILNLDSIIYLIGVQELGQGKKVFKKDEKINLMHIAICKLLEPYGYYEFDFFDPLLRETNPLDSVSRRHQLQLVLHRQYCL